jgi:hypothetical protein
VGLWILRLRNSLRFFLFVSTDKLNDTTAQRLLEDVHGIELPAEIAALESQLICLI